MSFTFQGHSLIPGMHDDRFTDEAQFLWGRWDQVEYVQAVLSSSATDPGSSPTTQLRAGLAVGKITSSGKLTAWNPYATDGSNFLIGFLVDAIDLSYLGSTKERLWAVVVKGNIKASWVCIPGGTIASASDFTRGISGKYYEYLLREQAHGRFLFDDDLGASQVIKEYTIPAATTNLTITAGQTNTVFVTDSALAASCTVVLPAPRPGLVYHFAHPSTTVGTQLILDGPATGEFWVAGAAANTVTLAGDNTTGLRTVRCVRVTDTTTDVFAYVVDGVAA